MCSTEDSTERRGLEIVEQSPVAWRNETERERYMTVHRNGSLCRLGSLLGSKLQSAALSAELCRVPHKDYRNNFLTVTHMYTYMHIHMHKLYMCIKHTACITACTYNRACLSIAGCLDAVSRRPDFSRLQASCGCCESAKFRLPEGGFPTTGICILSVSSFLPISFEVWRSSSTG